MSDPCNLAAVASARLVPLTTAGSTFEGRVIVARLGAEGILAQLRGSQDGPYPLPGPVVVLVADDQQEEARELLMADQVEAVFEPWPE